MSTCRKLFNFRPFPTISHWKRKLSVENIEAVKLSFASYETKNVSNLPPLIIMHGLLGSKRNWKTHCKRFLKNTKPQRKIIAIDVRNHGDSAHSSENTYNHMIADFSAFLQDQSIKKASLLGHSMGGMVAMYFALKNADLVEKIIVADIAPKKIPMIESFGELFEILKKIKLPNNIPMTVARSLADQQLTMHINDANMRMFLLTNLINKGSGRYGWRVNIEALQNNLSDIATFPDVTGLTFIKPALFVGGEKSDMIKPSDHENILKLFPHAEFFYIENAGHWLHAEKAEEFSSICVKFLNTGV